MVLVFSGACLSSREERVVLYESTRSDKLVGGRVMSREERISCVNLEMLIDLRQRKENSDKGGGGSGEMVKVEKMGK